MPLCQAINLIKSLDLHIKGVQLIYDDQNPLSKDLIVDLTQDGIRLLFDPVQQRLRLIEIYNLSRVKLKYCGEYFNAPKIPPTIAQIDASFGATHPAEYKGKQLLILNFRGLSFQFKIDPKLEPTYSHGIGSLRFPACASPIVSCLFIYSGSSYEDLASLPAVPVVCYHSSFFLEKLEIVREFEQTTLRFHLTADETCERRLRSSDRFSCTRNVTFGDSCEDVMSSIGCPTKVYIKDEDKMEIHSPAAYKHRSKYSSDYFYNYTTLGVDILFDAKTHRVKKFILHTNFPGHFNFNVYYRCNFHIPINITNRESVGNVQTTEGLSKKVDICFDTKWSSIRQFLIKTETKPVILNQASGSNPFGSTFCYGFRDMIFEIMPNDHIASVTIYKRKAQPSSENVSPS
jgi:hypothetical protein